MSPRSIWSTTKVRGWDHKHGAYDGDSCQNSQCNTSQTGHGKKLQEMEYAAPCSLSPTGSLVLLPDEIVRKMQQNVDIYIENVKSEGHLKGLATVTTHRLVWANARTTVQWSLAQVWT